MGNRSPWLAFLLVFSPLFAARAGNLEDALAEAFAQKKCPKAVAAGHDLQASGALSPEASYAVGYCFLQLHEPEKAQPYLVEARLDKNSPLVAYPSPQTLLARVARARGVTPKRITVLADDLPPPAVVEYADAADPWQQAVLSRVPEVRRVGFELFGDKVPSVGFYVFSQPEKYQGFYEAVLGRAGDPAETSVGSTHVVALLKSPEQADRMEDILHDFVYAWVDTYLMQGYDLTYDAAGFPFWLREGLAGYAEYIRDADSLEEFQRRVREAARHSAAPEWRSLANGPRNLPALQQGLYGDLSALLVIDLLSDEGEKRRGVASSLLDELAGSYDADVSAYAVSRKRCGDRYAALVKQYWSPLKP